MNKTTTFNVEQWISSVSIENLSADDYCSSVLTAPYLTVQSKQEETELYSKEQMLEMFRLGAEAATKTILEERAKFRLQNIGLKPYTQINRLRVGDSIYLSFNEWGAARSAASQLKKMYGKVFSIRKNAAYNEQGDIMVFRKK